MARCFVCIKAGEHKTDYEVALELPYNLKWGLIMACQLPALFYQKNHFLFLSFSSVKNEQIPFKHVKSE